MQNKIIEKIKSANRITVFSHINVDGDGVGSALALFKFCLSLKKQVGVFIDSVLPAHISWLADTAYINKNCEFKGDLAIIVDCDNKDRIGRKKFCLNKFKETLQIDHHADNNNFADLNYVVGGYSSTCEAVFDIFKTAGVSVTPDIAEDLLVGMLTDTGNLSYDSVTPNTFRKVAELLEISGKSINEFTAPLFSSNSMNIFELKKIAYERVEFLEDNQIAILSLSFGDLQKCGVAINDTKSILEIAYGLSPVKIVVAITEGEPDVCFVSFRSKCEIDCSKFAAFYGGGGHKKAAGCRIYDKLENVIESIKSVVKI